MLDLRDFMLILRIQMLQPLYHQNKPFKKVVVTAL